MFPARALQHGRLRSAGFVPSKATRRASAATRRCCVQAKYARDLRVRRRVCCVSAWPRIVSRRSDAVDGGTAPRMRPRYRFRLGDGADSPSPNATPPCTVRSTASFATVAGLARRSIVQRRSAGRWWWHCSHRWFPCAPPAAAAQRWCTKGPLEQALCPALTIEAPRETLRLAVADTEALWTRASSWACPASPKRRGCSSRFPTSSACITSFG